MADEYAIIEDSNTHVPLTTAWQPPSPTKCLSYSGLNLNAHSLAINNWELSTAGGASCYPPHYAFLASGVPHTRRMYSPGVCPQGYTTAASSYIAGEMYARCCSLGYTLSGFNSSAKSDFKSAVFDCTSTLTSDVVYSVFVPTATASAAMGSTGGRAASTTNYVYSGQTNIATAGVAFHGAIGVAWKTVDLLTISQSVRPTLNASVPAESAAISLMGSAVYYLVTATAAASSNQSISMGEKVGIGVGVAIAVLAVIAGIGVYIWINRRKRRENWN